MIPCVYVCEREDVGPLTLYDDCVSNIYIYIYVCMCVCVCVCVTIVVAQFLDEDEEDFDTDEVVEAKQDSGVDADAEDDMDDDELFDADEIDTYVLHCSHEANKPLPPPCPRMVPPNPFMHGRCVRAHSLLNDERILSDGTLHACTRCVTGWSL